MNKLIMAMVASVMMFVGVAHASVGRYVNDVPGAFGININNSINDGYVAYLEVEGVKFPMISGGSPGTYRDALRRACDKSICSAVIYAQDLVVDGAEPIKIASMRFYRFGTMIGFEKHHEFLRHHGYHGDFGIYNIILQSADI